MRSKNPIINHPVFEETYNELEKMSRQYMVSLVYRDNEDVLMQSPDIYNEREMREVFPEIYVGVIQNKNFDHLKVAYDDHVLIVKLMK